MALTLEDLQALGLTPEDVDLMAQAILMDKRMAQEDTVQKYQQRMGEAGAQRAAEPIPQGQVYEPGYQAPHWLNYVNAAMIRGQGRGEQGAAQAAEVESQRKAADILRQGAPGIRALAEYDLRNQAGSIRDERNRANINKTPLYLRPLGPAWTPPKWGQEG